MTSTLPFFRGGLKKDPKWTPDRDMPPQEGRVFVVTGGAVGIGLETTRQLLKHGARVYVLSRSQEKSQTNLDRIRAELEKEGPSPGVAALGQAHFVKCDLSSLQSVRESAQEFLGKEERLDVLIANAGVSGWIPASAEGFEGQFATNCLGHHALIQHLLPAVRAAAADPSNKPYSTRIIILSSGAHFWPRKKVFDDLNDPSNKGLLTALEQYGRSKLGNIFTASRLSDDLAKEGVDVVVASVHPGAIRSELARQAPGAPMWVFNRAIMWPTWYGCISPLWAATSPEAADISGKYIVPWGQVGPTCALAKDTVVRDKVWDWCQEQTQKSNATAPTSV